MIYCDDLKYKILFFHPEDTHTMWDNQTPTHRHLHCSAYPCERAYLYKACRPRRHTPRVWDNEYPEATHRQLHRGMYRNKGSIIGDIVKVVARFVVSNFCVQ